MSYLNQWKRVCRKIEKESILFLQNPFYHNQLGRFTQLSNLKKNKNIKVISIVHDVNELRGSFDSKYFEIEFSQMLELADILIVHNERMKQWFIEHGVPSSKMFVLEIFDYLTDKSLKETSNFDKTITVAGNLSRNKSPYVYKLNQLLNLNVNLYGVNYELNSDTTNVVYKGAFPSNQIPHELNIGFGLVWDEENHQGNAVVNYTEREIPYTRIIEHKHFEYGTQPKTVITREYPANWKRGDEPYYPINDEKNNAMFAKYQEEAEKNDKVIFCGRLADYKYYDMHVVIERALEVVEKEFTI